MAEKRKLSLYVTPDCVEKLKRDGSETIECDDVVVELRWAKEDPTRKIPLPTRMGIRGEGAYYIPESDL